MKARIQLVYHAPMFRGVAVFWVWVLLGSGSATAQSPRCFGSLAELKASESISDQELLGRLVLAEGTSSGVAENAQCEPHWREIYQAIAWGVRARLAHGGYGKGLRGVIFKPGQFRPAISERSRFASLFLCPDPSPRWREVLKLVHEVVRAPITASPFLQDAGAQAAERSSGVSRVNQFYYPLSSQATAQPPAWAQKHTQRVRGLKVGGRLIPDECIWFYRN